MRIVLWFFSFAVLTLFACTEGTDPQAKTLKLELPAEPYAYNQLQLPAGSSPFLNNMLPDILIDVTGRPINQNAALEITPWGATLGRVLFYDPKLSLNNTVSCGSCHHQDKAFTDGLAFSKGFEGRTTTRSTMAIVNPVLQNNLFWDSRSKTLHELSLQPVQNHIEMGMENLDMLVSKLKEESYYPELFRKAYGDAEITPERISKSISQFVASITSNRSKFDAGLANNFANFSELEKMGMHLFNSDKAKCASCHGGNNMSALDGPNDPYGGGGTFTGNQDLRGATNIGLDLVYADEGLGDGKFKIPTLRNISLTAPYMHDGRYKTLEEVVDFYSEGIKPHKHLDVKFTDGKGNVVPLKLSSIEKKAIIAFLHTLTDREMTKDPKWSNPFRS